MKTARLLKMLSLISFLLLFAPFYDSCNGDRTLKIANKIEVTEIDSVNTNNDSLQSNKIESKKNSNLIEGNETPFYQKIYDFIDDEESENAIEFASLNQIYFYSSFDEFQNSIKKGIHENDYKGFFFGLKNFCFLLIVIITFLISIFSFKNTRLVYKLTILNLTLLSITVICLFFEGFFETISQIKWGYYVFTIVNLFIFYFSKKRQ